MKDEIDDLPRKRFNFASGTHEDMPEFLEFIKIVRMYIQLFLAGDDTGAAIKYREDRDTLA